MENYVLNNIEVGERIRKIRKQLKMSREAFAELINISDIFLGQIERGERSLSIMTLASISTSTGVSTDYILFGTPEEIPTLKKITNIVENGSDNFRNYAYDILLTSITYFRKNEKDIKKEIINNLEKGKKQVKKEIKK